MDGDCNDGDLSQSQEMIWQPRRGQRVRIHYNRRLAAWALYHGCKGIIKIVGRGPGPRNCLIDLDDGREVCVPRGNLIAEGSLDDSHLKT